MTWQTHALVGANVAWLAALLPSTSASLAIVGALGRVAALLPDIDAQSAKIHYIGKGILGIFRGLFEHRGFFHSFLAVGIVGVISSSIAWYFDFEWSLPLAVTLGYASHLLIDGFTIGGVRYLFPRTKKFRLLPKAICTTTKGNGDIALLIFAALGLVIFFWLHYQDVSLSAKFLSL